MSINRTAIVMEMHPCYEMDDGSYLFTKNPSIFCVLLYIFLSLLTILTILGNLLVIIPVIYFKQLHTPTNSLILSLAVADELVGLLVFPFSMAFSLSSCVYQEHLVCKIRASCDIALSTCSILNLCCISVDRYYAVCRPLTYSTTINDRVVVSMILICWSVSSVIGVGLVVGGVNQKKPIGPVLSFYVPVIIMLSIYLKIYLVAQKQARTIQSIKSTGASVSKTERKATKTLAIVLGVFLLCWTPYFVFVTFKSLLKRPAPFSVIETLNWLTLANSMLNPFIYAFFYSWFRSAFRIIISGKILQDDYTNATLQ